MGKSVTQADLVLLKFSKKTAPFSFTTFFKIMATHFCMVLSSIYLLNSPNICFAIAMEFHPYYLFGKLYSCANSYRSNNLLCEPFFFYSELVYKIPPFSFVHYKSNDVVAVLKEYVFWNIFE